MLKMLILKGRVPAKIRPVISPDIHDNIIEGPAPPALKTTVGSGLRPPPTVVFANYVVVNIRRDDRPNFCRNTTLQNKHFKHFKDECLF